MKMLEFKVSQVFQVAEGPCMMPEVEVRFFLYVFSLIYLFWVSLLLSANQDRVVSQIMCLPLTNQDPAVSRIKYLLSIRLYPVASQIVCSLSTNQDLGSELDMPVVGQSERGLAQPG